MAAKARCSTRMSRDSCSIRTTAAGPAAVTSRRCQQSRTGAACRGRETHPAVRIPSTARTAIPRLEVLTAAATQLASMTRRAGSRIRTPETFIRGIAKALADEMEASDYLDGCAILAISAEASSLSETCAPSRPAPSRPGPRLSLSNWSKRDPRQLMRHPWPEYCCQDSRAPEWSSRPRGAGPHWSRRARRLPCSPPR